jgi:hypothetical protein
MTQLAASYWLIAIGYLARPREHIARDHTYYKRRKEKPAIAGTRSVRAGLAFHAIGASRAKELPGVIAVLTRADIPPFRPGLKAVGRFPGKSIYFFLIMAIKRLDGALEFWLTGNRMKRELKPEEREQVVSAVAAGDRVKATSIYLSATEGNLTEAQNFIKKLMLERVAALEAEEKAS